MEAVLSLENVHCQNHQSRKSELEKRDIDGLKETLRLYKSLERKAHDSRYTNYKIFDWEVHRAYKDLLREIIGWFNTRKYGYNMQIKSCDQMDDKWLSKYRSKDPECNKCH